MTAPTDPTHESSDVIIRRIGLLSAGVVVWQGARFVWENGNTSTDAQSMGWMIGLNAAGILLCALAVLVRPSPRLVPLIPLFLGGVFLAHAHVHQVQEHLNGTVLTTDGRLFLDEAAAMIIRGENPYAADLREAFAIYRAPPRFNTPLVDGDYTGRMPYPALSALVGIPFQLLGIDTSWVYPGFLAFTLAVIWRFSDPRWRPLVLVPFFAEDGYLLYAFGGVSDSIWASLLCITIAVWPRPVLRAVVFGLACSVKHQPWITAPFLLIKVWHETEGTLADKVRAMGVLVGISVFVFALINLPFVIADPTAWLTGSVEPLRAQMITFGQGLSALTMVGMVLVPRGVWSWFMLGMIGWSAWAYHRHYHRFPELPWVLPAAILFLGHRSLTSYWYYAAFPAMMAIVVEVSRRVPAATADRRASPGPTLAVLGALFAAVGATTVAYALHREPIAVAVVGPRYSNGVTIHQLGVYVRNDDVIPLSPRFQVHSNNGQQYFWEILTGPVTLEPGESGLYRIHADAGYEVIDTRLGGWLMVADAADASRRASVSVVGDAVWQFPDAIPNGAFRDWNSATMMPAVWQISMDPVPGGHVVPMLDQGTPARLALELNAGATGKRSMVRLGTRIAIPFDPVEVTVFVPTGANVLPELALVYGVSVSVGEETVWVLFGDRAATAELPDGTKVWITPVDRERWVRVPLDIREILADVGIEPREELAVLPRFESLDFPLAQMEFSLMVSVSGRQGTVLAPFGEVRNTTVRPDPMVLFERGREHPEVLERWLGEHNFRARNFDKAAMHFARAVALAPGDGAVWYRYGEALFWAGREEDAIRAFGRCLEMDYEPGMAWKGIGWAYATTGRYDDAVTAFRNALATFPADMAGGLTPHVSDAHIGEIRSLVQAERCEEVAAAVQGLLDLDPREVVPEDGLGDCAGRVELPTGPSDPLVIRADTWRWLEPAPRTRSAPEWGRFEP